VIFPIVPIGIVKGKHLRASIGKCPMVQKIYDEPIKLAPSKKKNFGHNAFFFGELKGFCKINTKVTIF
jgi:hypothetical protein